MKALSLARSCRIGDGYVEQMLHTASEDRMTGAYTYIANKVRWRLIVPTVLFMLLSSVDRVNVSFAALQMNADLGFSPSQYGFGAGILFVGFLTGQYPSVLLLQRIGFHRWLAGCALLWGACAGGMALINSHTAFYTLRVLLGFAEGGLAPGIVLYLSQFATERERATTFAMPMLAIPVSIVIGGPISGWLMGINAPFGLAGWRWMFLGEALPTIVFAFVAWFSFPDSPTQADWLDDDEKTWLSRNAANRAEIAQRNDWSVLKQPLVWASALLWFCLLAGSYGIIFWLPQMVKQMTSLTPVDIGFVNALPWIANAFGIYFGATSSDRSDERFWHIALPAAGVAGVDPARRQSGREPGRIARVTGRGRLPGRGARRVLGAADADVHAGDLRGRRGGDQHHRQHRRAGGAVAGRAGARAQHRLLGTNRAGRELPAGRRADLADAARGDPRAGVEARGMSDFDILAVGDVGARRANLPSMFAHVAPTLSAGPVVFGQLETVVSDRGAIVPNAKLAMRSRSALAPVLAETGFTMMSFAGNHCLDWGFDAFSDTLAHMDAAGVAIAGAGPDRTAAFRPVYQQVGDTRVALIAASAILPDGYAATKDSAGCAPLRAHTFYEQIEHDQPGTPARVRTHADRADLASLLSAIREARTQAQIVLVSLHWGIHMVRGSLAEYQVEVAHAAIDAGADAILGHHPHLMKGIGFHAGKPIFYSLGNFAIEQPHVWDPAIVHTESFRHLVSLNPSWSFESSYMLPEETRFTGIVRLVVRDGAIAAVRFHPAWIGDESAPRLLDADDPLFARVQRYLAEAAASEGLATHMRQDGAVLILSAA